MSDAPVFIPAAGGSIASVRVLDGTSPLKWAVRERSVSPVDNGWRFFSMADDDAFLADPANMRVADFNSVAAIEPAVLAIWSAPVGSDLQLVREADGRLVWYDNTTGKPHVSSTRG